MSKLVLVPHNIRSRSARALAGTLSEKLGYRVHLVRPSNVRDRTPFTLREGTDKLTQLQRFKANDVDCPEFTTDRNIAASWLRDGGGSAAVVCRTLLRGSEGRGIVVAGHDGELVPAPLYTRYTKKKQEFRVHVLNGKVIDIQEKRKKREFTADRDHRIRNLANGYVFCRSNVVVLPGLEDLGITAVRALDYSLGAVDIGYNEHDNRCFVFEVNSTPGMEGTTLQKYSDAIIASVS